MDRVVDERAAEKIGSGSERLDALLASGVDFVAAVPCSYLKRFLGGCGRLGSGAYLAAVREDHALAAAAGVWLAGGSPLVAMQNSGLGYCLEVLTSLHLLYQMPLPMLVSDRGAGPDFEEHVTLGRRTRHLLDLFDVPWREAMAGREGDDADWLVGVAAAQGRPAVLLVGQGSDT